MPPAKAFADRLNEQIANEFAAHQQYVACAVYYDSDALPQLARFFYRQALEERGHAMMMVQFLLDTGAEVTTPGVAEPRSRFAALVEPIALALEQEQRVSEQFVQWFIKEQTEEVATMSALLRVAERAGYDAATVEDFLAREHAGEDGGDPTAPQAAGAG
jgi:ferritin